MFIFNYKSKMKINQRYHNSDHQKFHKSRLYQKYKNNIQDLIQNKEELSFQSIQTPGWTSLVGTEQSKDIKKYHYKKQQNSIQQQKQHQNLHEQILNRLNSLPKLDKHQQFYTNIRLHPQSLSKNKNIVIYDSEKRSQKKVNQTPKTNSNKFVNRFNNKSKIQKMVSKFMSAQKSNQNKKYSSKKGSPALKDRISSVKSLPNMNLKDLINKRLQTSNNRQNKFKQNNFNYLNTPSDFDSKIQTRINYDNLNSNKQKLQTKNKQIKEHQFYSKIHETSNNNLKISEKNQYLNRYLNKLHQRSQSTLSRNLKQKNSFNNNQQNCIKIKQVQTKLLSKPSRFKNITVYDHLYQNSLKLQAKKNVARLIDDSYNKTNICTFIPQISQKSNQLAESKILRQSQYLNRQSLGNTNLGSINESKQSKNSRNFHLNCLHKDVNITYGTVKSNYGHQDSKIYTIQQKFSIKQKQKMRQKLQNRTLIKLFSILSNNKQKITQKTLQQCIQKLPLPLIQLLEIVLTKIYQKSEYKIDQFLQLFTQDKQNKFYLKQISQKKNTIIAHTQKYIKNINNSLKKQKNQEQKQNQNYNGNRHLQIYFKDKLKM